MIIQCEECGSELYDIGSGFAACGDINCPAGASLVYLTVDESRDDYDGEQG
jgi:hypothetical protein